MSLVYDHTFNKPEAEFRKNQDFMDPYYPNQQQEQLNHSNGSARYRSTPSNLFHNSVVFENGSVENDGDYRSFRSPSPKMDSLFADSMKKEPVTQHNSNLGLQDSGNCGSSMIHSFGFINNGGFETPMQVKPVHDSSDGSCLVKQLSSPGILSNLMIESDFSYATDFRDLRNSNDVHGEARSSKTVVNSHMNLEYGRPVSGSSTMYPHVSDIGSDFSSGSWNKASFNVFKGTGGTNIRFSGSEAQNGNSKNRLIHHLSLPTTFSEKDRVEKFLHFQGTTVPCKVRAKRGFATHPRSIAERVRRNRISQRMKKLQDLFPDMDKQTSTADMLDMAVDHIKELQKQVKGLNESRANCICYGKANQN